LPRSKYRFHYPNKWQEIEFYIEFEKLTYLVPVEEFRKDNRKRLVFGNSGND